MTPSHAVEESSTIAGDVAEIRDHRYTSPEIGRTSDGRSPGSQVNDGRRSSRLPSDHKWRRLTAYSCGGSRGFGVSAGTAFPFDPLKGTIADEDSRRSGDKQQ